MSWEDQRLARSTDQLPEDFFDKLALVDTAAALAGVTPSTVHNWISRGYVDRHGQRQWLTGFTIGGKRYVLPVDALRADAEVSLAARGGLRRQAM